MANFDIANIALRMICPNNVMQNDDTGLPSIMVYIPAFKNSDVLTGGDDNTHPAFIVNGIEIPGFYYSKYQNIVHKNVAYSLPGEDPKQQVAHKNAQSYCNAKGAGWHLSTAAEWAAIALWCKKNGFLPYGNNNYGKDSRENNYKAIPSYMSGSRIMRVATGTGPLTWSHDKTLAGIWDMNGNVAEYQAGLRIVWGELQIFANNDAADPANSQDSKSTCWKAINAADGSLVEPESKTTDSAVKTSGSTVKLDYVSNVWTYSTGITSASSSSRTCTFGSVACDDTISDATKVLLRALALLPDEGTSVDEYEDGSTVMWKNSTAENRAIRGGSSTGSTTRGVFCLICGSYTGAVAYTGFRCAYIPEIGEV